MGGILMNAVRQSIIQSGHGDDFLSAAGALFLMAIPVAGFALCAYLLVRLVKWAWTHPA